MKVRVENITPRKAQQFLTHNRCNRKLRPRRVKQWQSMMEQGHWHENGDPIRFNGDGDLIDGQHRLHACVASGKSWQCVVIRELPQEAYQSIDRGAPRNVEDTLHTEGYKSTVLLRATMNVILGYATNVVMGKAGSIRIARELGVTDDHYLAFLKKHKSLEDAVAFTQKLGPDIAKVIPTALLAGWKFLFDLSNLGKDDEWWEEFALGSNLQKESPRLAFRRFLVREASNLRKLPRATIFYAGIATFEKERRGEQVKHFKIPQKINPRVKGVTVHRLLKDFDLA